MSDLSRLRARLVRIEKTGRRLKRELAEARGELDLFGSTVTRTQERHILRLEEAIKDQRQLWQETNQRVKAEERRLLADPDAFLRFT